MPTQKTRRFFQFIKQKLSSRKFLIPFLIFMILALSGGFFYFHTRPTPPEKWEVAPYSPVEDYKVVEIDGTRKIINERAGVSFEVPEGWRIRKKHNIFLLSPEMEEESPPPNMEGCLIYPEIKFLRTSFSSLDGLLKEGLWGFYITHQEETTVDNTKSIGYEAEVEKSNLYTRGIATPINKFLKSKVLLLNVESSIEDKNKCSEAFESFLRTVSIK